MVRVPIYIRITIDTDSDEISLGQKVHANQWDDNKKSIKTESENASFLNSLLLQARTDIQNHFTVLKIHNMMWSPLPW